MSERAVAQVEKDGVAIGVGRWMWERKRKENI